MAKIKRPILKIEQFVYRKRKNGVFTHDIRMKKKSKTQ